MSKAWPQVAIGSVAKPIERLESPLSGKTYRQIGVRLWGQGAYERESIDGSETKYKTLNRVKNGDIIVNKIWARNGSVSVVSNELEGCYCSGEFPIFEPMLTQLEPKWFYWITRTHWFWEKCDAQSRGTSGKNRIRPEKFMAISIPLPSLAEQQRIVEKIEQLAGKIEEAKRIKEITSKQLIKLFEVSRSKAITEAFKFGKIDLTNVANLERGKFSYRPRNDPRFFGGDHPWIQIGEIESSKKYIQNWTQTLNDDGLAISRKFRKGTLLISIAATIGAVGILDFDCCIPDSIVAIIPRPSIDTEFLYHYLGFLRTHLEEIAPQSAQKNINLNILSQLPFPNIPTHKQHNIATQLDRLQTKIDCQKAIQTQTTTELNALLPAILDKAFKGEL